MSDTSKAPVTSQKKAVFADNPDEVMRRLDRVSHVLDNAFRVPGTNYRVGIDPLLGLVPVVGDAPATLMSAYIVVEAARLGAPRATLLRMLFNLLVDAVFGSIPVLGTLVDVVWKANARNVALLDERVASPERTRSDRLFMLGVGAVLVSVLLITIASTGAVVWWTVSTFGV
ncbi:MAG: DUF4112 domain-containing protein [Halobacteriota archaeon]